MTMADGAYHEQIAREETPQAHRIAAWVIGKYNPGRVADFGCSSGLYLEAFMKAKPGIMVTGIENSPAIGTPWVRKQDLTVPFTINPPAHFGMCLEVGEHISDAKSDILVDNLVANCSRLLFSAALPGQGGVGHINCQPKKYWIEKFEKRGWVVDYEDTYFFVQYVRESYHLGWLDQNALIFRPITCS